MPTYQYACTECGHAFDQVQSFSDDALTECPECEGRLRKLFNAVGVVFKGSGFYRNDSRGKAPAESGTSSTSTPESGASTTKGSDSSSGATTGSGSSGGSESSGTTSKPAASKPASSPQPATT